MTDRVSGMMDEAARMDMERKKRLHLSGAMLGQSDQLAKQAMPDTAQIAKPDLDWLGPISTALADRHLGMRAHNGYDLHMLPTVLANTARICHSIARLNGWYDNPNHQGVYDPSSRNPFELIALMHAELSELLERLRNREKFVPDQHCPQFDNAEIEAADLIIRLLDMSAVQGWRIGAAIVAKMAANERRPHRHGGKLA